MMKKKQNILVKSSMSRQQEHKVIEYNKEIIISIGTMTKKITSKAFLNAIKVLVTPWEKGFSCGIVMDSKNVMTTEEYELCSTIARGMIKMATTDPHSTFLWGLRGFADDKKQNKEDLTINSIAEFDSEDNVIDFLEFLKQKRDKELN